MHRFDCPGAICRGLFFGRDTTTGLELEYDGLGLPFHDCQRLC